MANEGRRKDGLRASKRNREFVEKKKKEGIKKDMKDK